MAQRKTRWLDTGSGPGAMVPVSGSESVIPTRVAAADGKMQTAYQTYTAHWPCEACELADKGRCPTAESLWRDYREARLDNPRPTQ